jgi:hypothetical protein
VSSSNPSDEAMSEAAVEVVAVDPAPRPSRRSFTAAYKARIVAEYEGH